MAEYIDRDAFLERMKRTDRYFAVKYDIENFPAADVAPVVHCRECERFRLSEDGIYYCYRNKLGTGVFMKNDDFCSYGVKYTGDTGNG